MCTYCGSSDIKQNFQKSEPYLQLIAMVVNDLSQVAISLLQDKNFVQSQFILQFLETVTKNTHVQQGLPYQRAIVLCYLAQLNQKCNILTTS